MRQKSASLINILGLSLGMAVFLIIVLFVRNERQFDRFHSDHERIFRLVAGNPADIDSYAGTPAPLGPAIQEVFPEIDAYVRFETWSHVVSSEGRSFREPRLFFADSTFFTFFTFPLIAGDPVSALKEPDSIVLTESMSRKYFGDENPMGRILHIHDRGDFVIRGVAYDLPVTSHFHFDFVIPFEHITNRNWGSWNYFTFVRFHENIDAVSLKAKIDDFFQDRELGEMLANLFYQPITNIHFQYNRANLEPAFNGQFLLVFQVVAFLVLLMACLNFVNLSTAYAQRRAREVGVKKAVGGARGQIMYQFIQESLLLALLAEALALVTVTILLPALNQFAGRSLTVPWQDPVFWTSALGLILLVGVLAGSYPAFILASIKPTSVFRGEDIVRGRSGMRAFLVVVQFGITIALVVCTLFIGRQLRFIQSMDLGYNREAIVNVRLNQALLRRGQEMKNAFLNLSEVETASVNSYSPNSMNWHQSVYWEGQTEEQRTSMWLFSADTQFFETLEITMLEGSERLNNRLASEEKRYFVINEAALEQIGWDRGEGRIFDLNSNPMNGEILGVTGDFHFRSLHHAVAPLAIYVSDTGEWLSLRLRGTNIGASLASIRSLWEQLAPGFDFEYEFIDDRVAQSYRSEQRLGQLLNIFTVLSLVIACLGLFSLASFLVTRKTKEIGIRKVMGASTGRIAMRLTRRFTQWVLWANLLAWPIAYWGVRRWLDNFVYRVDMSWDIFLLAGTGALLIAAMTVGIKTVKAARANPVQSLK